MFILGVKDHLLAFFKFLLDFVDPGEVLVRGEDPDELGGSGPDALTEEHEVLYAGVVDGDDVVLVGVLLGVGTLLFATDEEALLAEGAGCLGKDLIEGVTRLGSI